MNKYPCNMCDTPVTEEEDLCQECQLDWIAWLAEKHAYAPDHTLDSAVSHLS